jgi:hypothetical protein
MTSSLLFLPDLQKKSRGSVDRWNAIGDRDRRYWLAGIDRPNEIGLAVVELIAKRTGGEMLTSPTLAGSFFYRPVSRPYYLSYITAF